MENNTSKNFVLQLGALAALYVSITFLTLLLFSTVNLLLPDAIDSGWEATSNQDTIRLSIAVLVVFLPAYLYLTRVINNIRRATSDQTYLGLVKWLIYISLFVGGAILLGDLATVIYTFLSGEMTLRFIAKALILAGIIGLSFNYYLRDVKGYWLQHEKQSVTQGVIISIIALVAMILGYMQMDTPSEVREKKIDAEQITDLTNLQYQIENHLNRTGALPANLDEVSDFIKLPARGDRPEYEYKVDGSKFSLCAEFAFSSAEQTNYYYSEPYRLSTPDQEITIKNYYDWNYKAGYYCFDREVTFNK